MIAIYCASHIRAERLSSLACCACTLLCCLVRDMQSSLQICQQRLIKEFTHFDGLQERLAKQPSKRRGRTVEETLQIFKEMQAATELGLKNCLRFRMDPSNDNGTLRDPVAYRCNLTPHLHTGTKYKVQPTSQHLRHTQLYSCSVIETYPCLNTELSSCSFLLNIFKLTTWQKSLTGMLRCHAVLSGSFPS